MLSNGQGEVNQLPNDTRSTASGLLNCKSEPHMLSLRRTPRGLPSPIFVAIVAFACQSACQSAAPRATREEPTRLDAQQRAFTLAPGNRVDLDLEAGERWQQSLTTSEENLLVLVAEQRSLGASITVEDLEGEIIAHADGPGGLGVDERLAVRLPAGSWVVALQGGTGGPEEGRVRLRVETLRRWQPGDTERLRLNELGQRAAHLDGSNVQSDWELSYELSKEGLAGWRTLGDTGAIIRTLNRIVSLEREFGMLDASISHGLEAVELSLMLGDARAEAASRYWLAQSLDLDQKRAGAGREYAAGLLAARRAGDLRLQGRILNWQGIHSQRRGQLEEARDLLTQALALRLEAKDLKGVTSMLNNLANVALDLGDNDRALERFGQAIEISRMLDTPGAGLLTRTNMAHVLLDRGQWQDALDTFETALSEARRIGDRRNEAKLCAALARALIRLGEREPARELLERALEIERERRDAFYQISILRSLGWLHMDDNEYEPAETVLTAALALCRRHGITEQEALTLKALSKVLRLQGKMPEARELLTAAQTATRGQRPQDNAKINCDIAEVELSLNHLPEAEAAVMAALTNLRKLEAPETRFTITYLQARLAHARGELDEASERAEFALSIAETLRSSVDDPDLKATFLSSVREAYDFSVGVLLDLHAQQPEAGYDREAFAIVERGRARSLVELLRTAREGAEKAVSPELLLAERTALAALARARQRRDSGDVHLTASETAILDIEIEIARNRLVRAENTIWQAAPRFAELRYGGHLSVDELQGQLDSDTVLVEYSLRPVQSLAFVVSRTTFEVVELSGEATISAGVADLREVLVIPRRRALGQLQERSERLGELLVEPLLDAIRGAQHLIVIPDGPLAYLPFEAIRVREPEQEDSRYLIERSTVTYAPSAGVLLSLDEESNVDETRALVAFGDPRSPPKRGTRYEGTSDLWEPLPGAQREIAAVAETVAPSAVDVFLDQEASERELKSRAAKGRIRWLHLAAHASINEQTPANSAIVLAADLAGEDDGYLTVEEIFSLKLDAELVVLSGCETALGRHIRGEGLLGLTRAFLYAGARGVQVSLWKVADDTTPELMSSFYRSLMDGKSAAEALRQAKLESLADPRRSHPFHWAPFVMVGRANRSNTAVDDI